MSAKYFSNSSQNALRHPLTDQTASLYLYSFRYFFLSTQVFGGQGSQEEF